MHTHIHNPSPNRLSETNFRTNVTSFASGFTAASFWALFSFCFYSTYIIYEALFCVKMLSIPWFLSPTACHILECSDGLAQSVINTIGQAFELQFKQYLHSPPKTMAPMERWHWKLIFLPELKKKKSSPSSKLVARLYNSRSLIWAIYFHHRTNFFWGLLMSRLYDFK